MSYLLGVLQVQKWITIFFLFRPEKYSKQQEWWQIERMQSMVQEGRAVRGGQNQRAVKLKFCRVYETYR